MCLENNLNDAILKITMKIRIEYPELSKYLNEMVVTIPNVATPEMTNKVLLDYYNSLGAMLYKYEAYHDAAVAK